MDYRVVKTKRTSEEQSKKKGEQGHAGVAIGAPVDNVRIYLLDLYLNPCPQGERGEIYISGFSVARGYLRQPGRTAAVFLPDPFSPLIGARMYRTGDIGVFDDRGAIRFLGRADDQIKIRGFRVEPGEIAEILKKHDAVKDALVVVTGQGNARALGAYLIPRGVSPDLEEVRHWCADQLPSYMVPTTMMCLEAFPINANGKVDRKNLPPLVGTTVRQSPPRGETEKALAEVWAELLPIQSFNREDGFMASGGNSLTLMQLLTRIREHWGLSLSPVTLYENQSLMAMATVLESRGESEDPDIAIEPREPGQPVPAAFSQERLWFIDRMDPGNPAYNIAVVVRIHGPFDPERYFAAVRVFCQMHESTRTTFYSKDGQAYQRIHERSTPDTHFEDLSHLDSEKAEQKIRARFGSFSRHRFDLEKGPLLACKIIKSGEQDHGLAILCHHIVADGWSMGVFVRETSRLYGILAQDPDYREAPGALQFADFALQQRRALQGPVLERRLDYWRKALADAETVLHLPCDFPRPKRLGAAGNRVRFTLKPETATALETLASRLDATPFMVCQALFNLLLYRWSGQNRFLVGTPSAGRNRREWESMFGFFVNTLVLRADLSGNPSFGELTARVRETALAAFQHQDLPLEKIIAAVDPERDLSRHPLFQVMFVYQNFPLEMGGESGGVTIEQQHLDQVNAKFDLSLTLTKNEHGGMDSVFEYNLDLFKRASIQRLAGYMETLAEEIVADANQKIAAYRFMSFQEQTATLALGDQTEALLPAPLGHLVVAFESVAETQPHKTALVFGDQRRTYDQLLQCSRGIAQALVNQGLEPGQRVGCYFSRGPLWYAAMLGIMRAGGVYVPLDPAYPKDRLAYICEDAEISVVLCGIGEAETPDFAGQAAVIAIDEREMSKTEGGGALPRLSENMQAYIIYTSGSTGRPKGVVVGHRPACDHLFSIAREYGISEKDRVTQFASTNFDVSLNHIFATLLSGAALIIREENSRWAPDNLASTLVHHEVSVCLLPSAFWAQWTRVLEPDTRIPSLRMVAAGGEAMSAASVSAWRRGPLGHVRLHNSYGPTETVITSSIYWTEGMGEVGDVVPIGRALPGRQYLVLDEYMEPVAQGSPGELYIGGPLLADGYQNAAAMTAERFVPNPYGSGRLYRTGDRVRMAENGVVHFLGRMDYQVKIRGYRIEPGDIEAALVADPKVREAAVTALKEDGEAFLAAYVVLKDGAVWSEEALVLHLESRLPRYMIPSAWQQLERLPLTANGKVDRRALPKLSRVTAAYIAPQGETEAFLATLWQDLLKGKTVGRDDHFFALGGHSLIAMQMAARVADRFGIEPSPAALFEHPTLKSYASHLTECLETGQGGRPTELEKADRGRPIPLSFAQERLWFIERLDSGSAAYNIPLVVRIAMPVNETHMAHALSDLALRHETLRTRFVMIEGEARQIVEAEPNLDFQLEIISGDDAETRLQQRVTAFCERGFDLEARSPWRVLLIRLAADDHVLAVCCHHIISDGWSRDVLFRDLGRFYQAREAGERPAVQAPDYQFADYAVAQRKRLRGDVLSSYLDYWTKALEGVETSLQLPTDFTRPALQTYNGAELDLDIEAALAASVRGCSDQHTEFMLYCSVFQILLRRWSGQETFTLGTPSAGRHHTALEPLIGYFVNTIILPVRLDESMSFMALADQTRGALLGALAHQELPVEKLIESLQLERDLSRNPLFQVMFTFSEEDVAVEEETRIRAYPLANQVAKFDLTLAMTRKVDGRLRLSFEYNRDLFTRATIQRLSETFRCLLHAIAADPNRQIESYPLLDPTAREQMLQICGGHPLPAEALDRNLVDVFSKSAQDKPETAALWEEDHQISYREVDQRSQILARHLLTVGVRAGDRVGCRLGRGRAAYIAMLGILKAGAVYVPMDPAYPEERLAYIAEDAGIAALLRGRDGGGCTYQVNIIDLDTNGLVADAATLTASPELPEIAAHWPAYLIYTSGSTGKPKGVLVNHGAAAAHMIVTRDRFDVRAGETVLQFASTNFDVSLEQTFVAWSAAATLVPRTESDAWTPARFSETASRYGLNIADLPTAFWAEWVALNGQQAPPPSLRLIIAGGEAMQAQQARRWFQSLGRGEAAPRLFNAYGPTETVITATGAALTENFSHREGIVGIGRALAGRQVYVLDRRQQLQPFGFPGELCIGGPLLADGYINRPSTTASVFLGNPYAEGRLYRTGDLVRMAADGNLDFLGRIDQQVKIRGFRIELGEVESALAALDAVRAAVVEVKGQAGDRYLAAYLILQPEAERKADPIARLLAEQLPAYMIPTAWVFLEQLPVTANGKVDRKALPEPDQQGAETLEPLQTAAEEQLAEIWREVLEVENLGRNSHFFQSGGHSLRAMRVLGRVKQRFGLELSPKDLFSHPVLRDFAGLLDSREAAVPGDGSGPIRIDREQVLPLSFSQERLWFLDRLQPENNAYNLPLAIRIHGKVDADQLWEKLRRLVIRHESLRTRFTEQEGEPRQIIDSGETLDFRFQDFSNHEPGQKEKEALKQVQIFRDQPFDLAQGPLFRVLLQRLATDDHILVMVMHHIISDGWSMDLIARDLGRDLPAAPDSERLQYADFAFWQRSAARRTVQAEQTIFWQEILAGHDGILELPCDFPRPKVQGTRGGTVRTVIDPDTLARLQQQVENSDATLFMWLLAAYQLLLGRFAQSRDVLVGTPSAGRTLPELEDIVGFFVNTIVIRGDMTGNPSFQNFLNRVRETALGAFAHQDVAFENVLEAVQPRRDLSRNPLYQVLFTLQNNAAPVVDENIEVLELENHTAKFDLSLTIYEQPGSGTCCALEYAADLFSPRTAENLLNTYLTLLDEISIDPSRPLSAYRGLTLEAVEALLKRAEAPAIPAYNRDPYQAVAVRAAQQDNAVALQWDDQTWTYGQLLGQAEAVASGLRGQNVRPGQSVGVYLQRGPWWYAAMLGILKVGAVYLPLDPEYPPARTRYMIEDAQPVLILTDEAGTPDSDVPCLAVEQCTAGEPVSAAPVDSDSPAYLIYTSGSTGKPKAVVISRQVLAGHIAGAVAHYGITAEDKVLQFASTNFDVSLEQTFVALTTGAALVIRGTNWNADNLTRQLERYQVTVANLPTALWSFWAGQLKPGTKLPHLRLIIAGGEAMLGESVHIFRGGPLGETRLLNAYGPTETAVTATTYEPGENDRQGVVAIGQPLPGRELYIVDENGRLVPEGFPGELRIGGPLLAQGYHRRPAQTAAAFIAGARDGKRLYSSGDLVRRDGLGRLRFLGRADQQVKIRGFRIEIGEIESRLLAFPQVHEAVVTVNGEGTDKHLRAYVTGLKPEDLENLRGFLAETLPEHMIPAAIHCLEALPLMPNGKLDRAALPQTQNTVDTPHRAPENAYEQGLAEIWTEVLKLAPDQAPGRDDHFFQRGGHSLLATRVLSRVAARWDVALSPRDIFDRPKLADFAALIRQKEGSETLLDIPLADRNGFIPLSPAQERLWFIDRMDAGNPAYNIPLAVRISAPFDEALLRSALQVLVLRHESLRTRIVTQNDQVGQTFLDVYDPLIVDHTVAGPEALKARLETFATTRFDLKQGPLFAVLAVPEGAESHVLAFCLHHIVADGWSIRVLINDLTEIAAALKEEREPNLPELTIQFADLAAMQQSDVGRDARRIDLDFWLQQVQGCSGILELPTDFPRPSLPTYAGDRVGFSLPAEQAQKLRELGQSHGATEFMVYMALFQLLLKRFSGADDVLVGTPHAGRDREALEPLIGYFVNTLVLRADFTKATSFLDLLEQVKNRSLGAFKHRSLPVEELFRQLTLQRDLSRNPLFQVLFSFGELENEAVGKGVEALSMGGEVAKFDLALYVDPQTDGSAELVLVYNTALYQAQTAHALMRSLTALAEAVVALPSGDLNRFPTVSPGSEHWAHDDQRAALKPAAARTLHDAVSLVARRRRKQTSLIMGNQKRTYRQLDAAAGAVAQALVRAGIGLGDRVGQHMGRGPNWYGTMLGIMRAGAVYVPLDPAYPAERLTFIAQDADLKMILADHSYPLELEGIPTMYLDERGLPEGAFGGEPLPAVPEEASAYIIYTSGSSGKPKGVLVKHGAAVDHLEMIADHYQIVPEDRVCHFASTNFDVSFNHIFSALLRGAGLVIRDESADWAPEKLVETLKKHEVSVLLLPSAYWAQWVSFIKKDDHLPKLRYVASGGDAMRAELVKTWKNGPFAHVLLSNSYGPTECVVTTSTFNTADYSQPVGTLPIGSALPGRAYYVLDSYLQPVDYGMPGELCIGGPLLADGYWQRPGLTAERFTLNPFAHGRLYRSGDLVRMKENGVVHFLGRIDRQVKIRGYRIELGEIESRLGNLEHVVQAAVEPKGEGEARRLVAYIVTQSEDVDGRVLAAELGKQVPRYMVPEAWVFLERLPITVNGKLDRRALPEPELKAAEYIAPSSQVAQQLAEIWCHILQVERVGETDSFFERGGNSLIAMQMSAQIRDRWGLDFSPRIVFEHPILADLAAVIYQAQENGGVGVSETIPVIARGGRLPLSHSQERIWFLSQISDHGYNMFVPVRIHGQVDVETCRRAVDYLVARHESLRTTFSEQDGQPFAVIRSAGKAAFTFEKHQEGKPDINRQVAELCQQPFDLKTGPLFRVHLIQENHDRFVFVMVTHHIVSDGISQNIILDEFGHAYEAFAKGEQPELLPLDLQFVDFAAWSRNRLEAGRQKTLDRFWRRELQGAEQILKLPTDKPRPAQTSGNGAAHGQTLSSELGRELKALAAREGATEFHLMAALFSWFLSKLAGQNDFLIGYPVAGRDHVSLQKVVGCFVNTLVLRCQTEREAQPSALIQRCKTRALDAADHGDMSFARLVEQHLKNRENGRNPLYQAMLVLQNTGRSDADPRFEALSTGYIAAQCDLTLNVSPRSDGGYDLSWQYDRDLFVAETLAKWAASFESLARRFCEFPDDPLPEDPSGVERFEDFVFTGEVVKTYPASYAQERLWFVDGLLRNRAAYNMPMMMRIRTAFEPELLRQTLAYLCERHEVLRTALGEDSQGLQQRVYEVQPVQFRVVDLRGVEDAEKRAKASMQRDFLAPFDLRRAPLWRCAVYLIGDSDYALSWVMHHIISDGWSLGILQKELAQVAHALGHGQTPPLQPLPIQYGDYAAELKASASAQAAMEARRREALRGAPHILEFPTDFPRPQHSKGTGSRHFFTIPARTAAGLQKDALALGVSEYMLWLALYGLFLQRICGVADVLIGTPSAGRDRTEWEGLLGYFINTLVMRLQSRPEDCFQDYLARSKDFILAAFEDQQVPFERLVEQLKPERDLDRNPLFQTMFTFQNLEAVSVDMAVESMNVSSPFTKFDLSLILAGNARDGYRATFEYSNELFGEQTPARFESIFMALVRGVVGRMDVALADLDGLDRRSRSLLLKQAGAPLDDFELPTHQSLYGLFQTAADRFPERPGLRFQGETWDYRSCLERVQVLSEKLLEAGVGPGKAVGVYLHRGPAFVCSLLAVQKCGAVYLPLDPHYPESRLAYMIEDAEPVLILKGKGLKNIGNGPVLTVDNQAVALGEVPVLSTGEATYPHGAAYLIYTSGSTGQPKGVLVGATAAAGHIHVAADYYGISENDRVLQFASTNFDVSIEQMFTALSRGACLVIREEGPRWSPEQCGACLRDEGITVANLPTAFWQSWVSGLSDRENLPDLRLLMVGGEALLREPVLAWKQGPLSHVPLINVYGPTETVVSATAYRMEGEVVPVGDPVAIGQALSGRQCLVLDQQGRLCPPGVAGELCIGGPLLAMGYHRRPQLTADRFKPNPYGEGRLYRSGDLVSVDLEGRFRFLGRVDRQVKIRGYRIELGEIESAIRALQGIAEAAVEVKGQGTGKQLVGYVVGEQAPDKDAIMAALGQSLPDYMVPRRWMLLSQLPLTPNGKVDRNALPDPEPDHQRRFEPPANEAERQICEIWRQILKVERVGALDNFFELGGHSLLATRVIARVQRDFGIALGIRDFFADPTPRAMADHISAGRGATDEPPLVPVQRRGAMPVSFSQQRLWFIQQMDVLSRAYHMPSLVVLEGPFDVEAYRYAVEYLARRHETLRTVFAEEDGQPVQIILDTWNGFEYREVADEATALTEARHYLAQPFDLAKGPLYRCLVLRFGPENLIIAGDMHHIISDGWSVDLLQAESGEAYRAFVAGEEPVLPPLPVQYADFAVWQRRHLASGALQRQLGWWRDSLSGLPELLEMPTDRPRPKAPSGRGDNVAVVIPAETATALRDMTREVRGSMFMGLVALYGLLLSKYSGNDDIAMGTPIAGRRHADLENLIGFFVNTLVLRADLSGNPSFYHYLERTRDFILGAFEHQDVPFEKLVETLQPERNTSYTPLFQAMFSLQDGGDQPKESRIGPVRIRFPKSGEVVAKFDLTLTLGETADGSYSGTLNYNTDIFERDSMTRFARRFAALAAAVVAEPHKPMAALDWLDQAELQPVLQLGRGPQPRAPFADVLQAFRHWSQTRGGRPATTYHGRIQTYVELDQRSGQVAAYLLEHGLQPEDRVAVCMPKGPGSITALLGIIKAGGVYVPVAPDYPEDRRDFMVRDSGSKWVLTQAQTQELVAEAGAPTVILENILKGEAVAPQPVHQEQVAYMIYTSGSTGRPKGVAVTHRGLINMAAGFALDFDLRCDERVLQFASLSFDASIFEIFTAFVAGACLVLGDKEAMVPGPDLLEFLAREKVNMTLLPPSGLAVMNQADLPELRVLLTGGEACTKDLVDKWQPGRIFVNAYGPTEITVAATYQVCRAGEGTPSIGSAMPGETVYVLDHGQRPVPIGVPGELCIGGLGQARGYHARPELTAEKFIPDPFSKQPGARLYRSGDLVRMTQNGKLEFLGRIDHQVKLRGFRIELGEIENALRALPEVEQALVIAAKDKLGETRLIAYWTPSAQQSDAPKTDPVSEQSEALLAALGAVLPEFMIPAAAVGLAEFPMTANGKIDRRALPEPRFEAENAYVAPRDHVEEAVCRIWSDLLGREQVGIYDNFFKLGGHSLMAVRLMAGIRRELDLNLPLTVLFSRATPALLAEAVREEQGGNSDCLVRLSNDHDAGQPPLFLIHPVGGNVLCYAGLAQTLAPRPVFAFKSPGLEDGKQAVNDMIALADLYRDRLLEAYPQGPIHLAGWSMGGLVCVALADRLARVGRVPESITLIDTWAPQRGTAAKLQSDGAKAVPTADLPPLRDIGALFARDLAGLFGKPFTVDPETWPDHSAEAMVQAILNQAVAQNLFDADENIAHLQAMFNVFHANLTAMLTYQPAKVTVPMTLFRCDTKLDGKKDHPKDLGWTEHCAQPPVIHNLKGHHYQVFTPENLEQMIGIFSTVQII